MMTFDDLQAAMGGHLGRKAFGAVAVFAPQA
jgi:hypothetical protein